MTDLSRDEFSALRGTIRERGTARVYVFVFAIAVWAALSLMMTLVGAAPVFTLVPLVVLAAGFEAVFNLHVGVERIGRYLQAFVEDGHDAAVRWETSAMAFGGGFAHVRSDPLFTVVYVVAAFLNALPALGGGSTLPEIATLAGAHVVFVARVLVARRAAATQRERDLERFRALRDAPGAHSNVRTRNPEP